MLSIDPLELTLMSRFERDFLIRWRAPCQPRILIVCDGGLSYEPTSPFGLWRFIHAITHDAGVTNRPALTLARRNSGDSTVTIGSETYDVRGGFLFHTASPAVTLNNYDQVWLFGIDDRAFSLGRGEVAVLSDFMNSGGGVFATGDHGRLGHSLCSDLPRIRHMREWERIPMGLEPDVFQAVGRIDTVTDPGADGVYQFEDQSDGIPQRIYPNYRVIDTDGGRGTGWEARIHPLLALPGAALERSSVPSGATTPADRFSQDIDVLPDHPHESVCYAVTDPAVLNARYMEHGQNFPEWQPNAGRPSNRVGAEIVAYAVSGGRSVSVGGWKPPVRPQMFGVISAYDGRLAQPYPGKTQPPGRIVCDSTWHHFVNVNLDGTGSSRMGLGTWSGGAPGRGTFTPSRALQKIYAYYRNIVAWLQPANRVLCPVFWDLVALRYRAELFEELLDLDRLTGWRQLVGLGSEAARILEFARGREAVADALTGWLRGNADTAGLADLLDGDEIARTVIAREEILHGILGALVTRTARLLPPEATKDELAKILSAGPAPHLKALQADVRSAIRLAAAEYERRIERSKPVMQTLAANSPAAQPVSSV